MFWLWSRVGSGPPLVIVHGAWASGDSYLPVAELQGQAHLAHLTGPEILASEVANFLATTAEE